MAPQYPSRSNRIVIRLLPHPKLLLELIRHLPRAWIVDQVSQSDVVITTALIGGVFAPTLVTAEMVASMNPGSIIVDLAADGGGNCELSSPGQTIEAHGVRILAPLNLASTMPDHASLLFSRNLTNFIEAFSEDGEFQLDLEDEIQAGCLITKGGEIVHERTLQTLAQNREASS